MYMYMHELLHVRVYVADKIKITKIHAIIQKFSEDKVCAVMNIDFSSVLIAATSIEETDCYAYLPSCLHNYCVQCKLIIRDENKVLYMSAQVQQCTCTCMYQLEQSRATEFRFRNRKKIIFSH